MNRIDWAVLGRQQRGLAVEGSADKSIVEAFLEAGERAGLWANWRAVVRIEEAGSNEKVLAELRQDNPRVWGLIDRDWQTATEINALLKRYPRLLVLPRVMIENYCIDPYELADMLPPQHADRWADVQSGIESQRDSWVQNGALWQALHEQGAFRFCRDQDAYPMALLNQPVIRIDDIRDQFTQWHNQLDQEKILHEYGSRVEEFRSASAADNFHQHIHGKNFFHQIVVRQVLNPAFGQMPAAGWIDRLFSRISHCPDDVRPVFERLLQ
jgi:hypothetical protein